MHALQSSLSPSTVPENHLPRYSWKYNPVEKYLFLPDTEIDDVFSDFRHQDPTVDHLPLLITVLYIYNPYTHSKVPIPVAIP